VMVVEEVMVGMETGGTEAVEVVNSMGFKV
jgi:hypothetical protein